MKNRIGFTIVEMLIGLAILSVVIGISIVMMTRGAANVQRGSFNALAANQSFWIVTTMRNDISRSVGKIELGNDDNIWIGEGDFKFNIEGGEVKYTIETKGNRKTFVRTFSPNNDNTAIPVEDQKVRKFGDEYLNNVEVKKEERKEDGKEDGKKDISYVVTITMKEPKDNTDNVKTFISTATIYLTQDQNNSIDDFWVPTVEIAEE